MHSRAKPKSINGMYYFVVNSSCCLENGRKSTSEIQLNCCLQPL